MSIEAEEDLKKESLRIPFLLRILSIAILVEGILGLLFFILAGIYQLSYGNFTETLELNGFSNYFYSFYIILHILIFSGLTLSGLLLLKLRRLGFYIFIFSYLMMVTINMFSNNTIGWSAIVVGLSFFVFLAYFYKKMK